MRPLRHSDAVEWNDAAMPFFASQSREQLRRLYIDAWRKFREARPLEPLEAQIAAIIAEHPEYHALLEVDAAAQAEFLPESGHENPFLHMGLHLAIREQVSTGRPAGIETVHARLSQQLGSALEAEHRMLEALAETLWEAQRSNRAPDEQAYLERLERL